jgi:hypothetical protein
MKKRKAASKAAPSAPEIEAAVPWSIHFFQRHEHDDQSKPVPGRKFLDSCPDKVRMTMLAVLKAVADAPPPSWSGGGKWEAMHGDMKDYYEVRVDGPKRHHYRLFCVLERKGADVGLGGPSIVVLTGLDKPFLTVIAPSDYAAVRVLGDEYRARKPRSIALAKT